MSTPVIGIIMGSDSDLPVMQAAADILDEFGIANEMSIISAHRAPAQLMAYAGSAVERGLRVVIAGAGGAAHLPGVVAAVTPLPVIGVPVRASISLDGWDSILSILQMPPGVPVATVSLNGGRNAGILAAQILGASDPAIRDRIVAFKQRLEAQVEEKNRRLAEKRAADGKV
jgi:5-(carboxyamino)imidazole ribonucleotide mutase